MDEILSGVRVLDFTDALAAHCTRSMADCGAEVINIEKPGRKMARAVDAPPTAVAGESTDEVLKSMLNIKDDELAALKKEGIIFDEK